MLISQEYHMMKENTMSEHVHFDLEDGDGTNLPPQFVRWVQPPQIAYFINSIDKDGNQNGQTKIYSAKNLRIHKNLHINN